MLIPIKFSNSFLSISGSLSYWNIHNSLLCSFILVFESVCTCSVVLLMSIKSFNLKLPVFEKYFVGFPSNSSSLLYWPLIQIHKTSFAINSKYADIIGSFNNPDSKGWNEEEMSLSISFLYI